jgi:glycosyltransferase involved in cell wall biosynthesis
LPVGEAASQAAEAVSRQKHARARLALLERAYARARQTAPAQYKTRQSFLRILISTFNRREFVVMNVLWILKEILPKDDHSIELIVVDGGSTDGTLEALDGIKDPRLQVFESPTNVGMLAGLREAARLPGAEYIWLIGDDDLIRPEGFRAILAGLRQNRGVPLGFTNFAVYYRKALSEADRANFLIMGSPPVATDVAPTGLVKVRQAAEQTDNLFTAIYTVIWRADLLSAAYEHAFDGEPFVDLTEAIPCTDYILGRYGECDAFWHAGVGIAGNGYNSWSRHKPRWHGAVMPLALQLARDAGVDPVRLQTWADRHRGWLKDALAEARAEGRPSLLRAADRPLAEAVFRGDLPDAYDA